MSRWGSEPDDTGHGDVTDPPGRRYGGPDNSESPFTRWLTKVQRITGWRRVLLVNNYWEDIDALFRAEVTPIDAAEHLIRRYQ